MTDDDTTQGDEGVDLPDGHDAPPASVPEGADDATAPLDTAAGATVEMPASGGDTQPLPAEEAAPGAHGGDSADSAAATTSGTERPAARAGAASSRSCSSSWRRCWRR